MTKKPAHESLTITATPVGVTRTGIGNPLVSVMEWMMRVLSIGEQCEALPEQCTARAFTLMEHMRTGHDGCLDGEWRWFCATHHRVALRYGWTVTRTWEAPNDQ